MSSNKNTVLNRIYYVDIVRVLASIAVIITHVVMHNIYVFKIDSKTWNVLAMTKILITCAVPCFFMISGAMLLSVKNEENYWDFIKRRVSKIFIPFFIWSFVYFVYFSFILKKYEFDVYIFIKKFFNQGISGHFWYLYALFLLYLFMPFIKKLVVNLKRNELEILIIMLFIWGSVIPFVGNITREFYDFKIGVFTISKVGVFLNYMIIGYYLHTMDIKDLYRKKTLLSLIMIFAVSIEYVIVKHFSINEINPDWIIIEWAPIFVYSICIFSLLRIKFDKRNSIEERNSIDKRDNINNNDKSDNINIKYSKIIIKLSELSFTAYLVHMIILRSFQNHIPNDSLREKLANGGYDAHLITIFEAIAAILLSYLIAFITNKFIQIINRKEKVKL